MPATAYKYVDSKKVDNDVLTYFGFEKLDSPKVVQDRYQISSNWSDTKVRKEFDTLQLFDKSGNLNATVPTTRGNSTKIPEPITTSYPEFGNGGAQQLRTINPQKIEVKNVEIIKDR